MRNFAVISLLLLATGCAEATPQARSPQPDILPLRALRLYETGVGYFERAGDVGSGATALPVPAGHLDDALKSLVILDGAAGSKIAGVAFPSSVSQGVARSRAGLPVEGDKPITHLDLLISLKGEQVELGDESNTIVGRVIEVVEEPDDVRPAAEAAREDGKTEVRKPEPRMVPVLTLLTDKGEIVKKKGVELRRVRPLDAAFAARLDRAMDALSPRNVQRTRPLSLLGEARGNITFGYIAETPLWRTTYRLLLGKGGKGSKLQGWALVHNDTDESWNRVSLSLVNGQPDSFLFPLAAPRYVRRSLIHPEDALSTIPQLQDQTADKLWGDNPDEVSGVVGGVVGGSLGRLGAGHSAKPPSIRMGATSTYDTTVGRSSLLSVGNLADLAKATGVEQGALFTYTAAQPFSLDAHSSALVPFLQTAVEVEPVAWFSDATAAARIAVRFTNATGQTLPAGTLAVFAEGGFTGESALDRLKPGERRFIQFGNELDAEILSRKNDVTEESKRLTFQNNHLEEHFLKKCRHTWELENRSTAPRAFYVGFDAVKNASIKGPDALDFDETASRAVLVFRMTEKQKVVRSFDVVEGLTRSTRVEALTEKRLKDLAAKTTLPAAEAAIATEAAGKAKEVEATDRAIDAAKKDIAGAQTDVERLREHLKAAGGDKGAAGPLVKRLLDAEDKLAAATKKRDALVKDREAKVEALKAVLAKLPAPQ